MNVNDEFISYQPDAIDEKKALELAQKDQGFKDDIQTLNDNQEKLDSNYESLGSELRGKSQEDINKDKDGFENMRRDYDQAGIAADENREALAQKEGEYETFKQENIPEKGGREASNEDVEKGYEDLTGRKLNPGMSGNDMGDTTTHAPITEEVGEKAHEAAAPIKDQVTAEMPEQTAQRYNAFTQLEDSTPTEQTPEPVQEQTTAPNQEQASDQTAQRDNAFTESESSSPAPETSGQEQEGQATPTAAAPEQSGQRDNAFTQSGDANPPDQGQTPAPQQDNER